MKLLYVALLALLPAFATAAVKKKTEGPWFLVVTSTPQYPSYTTESRCQSEKVLRINKDAVSKISGKTTYYCRQGTEVEFGPAATVPVCTALKPAAETQTATCPAPLIGTYGQIKDFFATAYPTCWQQEAEWRNVQEPAQACAQPNLPPTISGTPPANVKVGENYVFYAQGVDPEGKPITYSITNRPAWSTFKTDTGRLSGTPVASHVGTSSNITISASDGVSSVSLPPFAVTVTQVVNTRSATLSWRAPTQNTDGTSLTNLKGYFIYYGTSAASLTQTIPLFVVSATEYVVDQLAPGTWYFAITAATTDNAESAKSNIASKVIQ